MATLLSASRVALLCLVVPAAGAALAGSPPDHPISIAEARTLPLGSVVTVAGSVSTPSGAFESSFLDQGFGLQDRTAGIYVSVPESLGLDPRRRARVTGMLADSFGLLLLVPVDPANDVTAHGVGPSVRAEWVTTGAVGESTEGLIVQVVGVITEAPISDLPYGYKFFVDDGTGEVQIYVNLQTGIDVSALEVGQVISVTGFSSQFDTEYEIDPRDPEDVVVGG